MKSVGCAATPSFSIIQPVSLSITTANSHYAPQHRDIHLEVLQQFEPLLKMQRYDLNLQPFCTQ